MIQIISNKTVNCTSCGLPVKLHRLKYIGQTEAFPQGAYQGKCPNCGAIFIYSADYIKETSK